MGSVWTPILLVVLIVASPWTISVSTPPEEAALVINEVMYDPEEGEEWLELYNAGPWTELGGALLSDQDGHDYEFPNLLFPPAAYLILVVGEGVDRGFEEGPAILHMGFSGSIFNNGGDDVLLEGEGVVLDYMSFGSGSGVDPPPPSFPWEGSAQTAPKGRSLSLQPSGLVEATAEEWKPSFPTPGGPNGDDEDSGILISEVYYHTFGDNEYVVLVNTGSRAVNLSHWTVSDGEGAWEMGEVPATLPGARFVLSQNATSLWEIAGLPSDACVEGCDITLDESGNFALANGGDEVVLYDPYGRVVDLFHYGSSQGGDGWEGRGATLLNRGYVARRKAAGLVLQDTDTALDWEWHRTFRPGQSFREVHHARGALIKPFSSPESSLSHLLSILDASREEIIVAGFKLTSWRIASSLVAALERGVVVRIGLEGTPPGGMEPEQETILSHLAAKGASVLLMQAGREGFRRYAFHHAKYVVVDGTWLIQGSENFSENGYPVRPEGNRGWGVVAFSRDLARWYTEVFAEDWNTSRSDVHVFLAPGPVHGIRGTDSSAPPLRPEEFHSVDVEVLFSPDNAVSKDGLSRVLREAAERVDVEMFYLRWEWNGNPNPLVELLIELARKGVQVRILLDGSPYNVEGKDDNDEVASRLNGIAAEEGIPLEARLLEPNVDGIVKLHNKGLVVDDRLVFTSSINWNYNGAYENRETGLLLSSGDLAAFFRGIFEEDWVRQLPPLEPVIRGPTSVRLGDEATYEAGLSVDVKSVTFTWDLHGDGTWDGYGPTYSFAPAEEGTYVLRLRAQSETGQSSEVEALVEVTAGVGWALNAPHLLIGVVSGTAAILLLRKLRTTREPTNKHASRSVSRERRGPDLGGGD